MSESKGDLIGLGTFIRSQRKLAQLSQRELAKLSKLSDPYVSQLERGLHEPSVRVLRALGSALNIPAEILMNQAGWLKDDETAMSTEDAIRHDDKLSNAQKTAMLEIYKGFTSGDDA